jgi:two-component system, chemotaxis family, chemotaxis protein CheY
MATVDYTKLRVLVVEDDDFTRQLIRKTLKDIGVRSVSDTSNGKDGLLELMRTRPDIVFCDVHMQPMNGRQFLQTVRGMKIAQMAKTPVVFLTADSDIGTVKFAKEHQVNGYLVKPISLSKLRDSIAIAMASSDSARERPAG